MKQSYFVRDELSNLRKEPMRHA